MKINEILQESTQYGSEREIIDLIMSRLPAEYKLIPRGGHYYVTWVDSHKHDKYDNGEIAKQGIQNALKKLGWTKVYHPEGFYEHWTRPDGSYPVTIGKQKVDAYDLHAHIPSIHPTAEQASLASKVAQLFGHTSKLGKTVGTTFPNAHDYYEVHGRKFTATDMKALSMLGLHPEGDFTRHKINGWIRFSSANKLRVAIGMNAKGFAVLTDDTRELGRDWDTPEISKQTGMPKMGMDLSPTLRETLEAPRYGMITPDDRAYDFVHKGALVYPRWHRQEPAFLVVNGFDDQQVIVRDEHGNTMKMMITDLWPADNVMREGKKRKCPKCGGPLNKFGRCMKCDPLTYPNESKLDEAIDASSWAWKRGPGGSLTRTITPDMKAEREAAMKKKAAEKYAKSAAGRLEQRRMEPLPELDWPQIENIFKRGAHGSLGGRIEDILGRRDVIFDAWGTRVAARRYTIWIAYNKADHGLPHDDPGEEEVSDSISVVVYRDPENPKVLRGTY